MILIADSGATKTDWCGVYEDGSTITFRSEGYNPNYITLEYMIADIRKTLPSGFPLESVNQVYFYGSGVTELQYGFVKKAVNAVFINAEVSVAMDLLASARALLGDKPGFAAILGTGTNSCIYDGKDIILNIDSLGFILGDEGSGAYMGKRLICDYIRRQMPLEVRNIVEEQIRYSGDELIDIIYTKPFPNRFCAQYSRFIGANIQTHEYFYNLVEDSIRKFFANIITHYPDYSKYKFNCVGSVGYAYREIIKKIAAEFGMECGKIVQFPMEGLIEFHWGR